MIPNRAAHHIIKSRLRLLYRQKDSETSHFGAYYVKQLSNPLLATLVPHGILVCEKICKKDCMFLKIIV